MYKGLESFARYMASQENVTFEDIVEELLIALGIPASLNGYGYLKEAIVIYHRLGGEGRRVRITKDIYPAVALKYKTSSACAERSMRHAVCTAFTRGSLSFIDSVFSLTVDEGKGKPTNSEFVAMLNHRAKWVLKRLEEIRNKDIREDYAGDYAVDMVGGDDKTSVNVDEENCE